MRRMKPYWLALTIFSLALTNCQSAVPPPGPRPAILPISQPPPPLPVRFTQVDGGLFLSNSDYRNLEKNIVRQRTYTAQLLNQLHYYRDILQGASSAESEKVAGGQNK